MNKDDLLLWYRQKAQEARRLAENYDQRAEALERSISVAVPHKEMQPPKRQF